MNPRKFAESQIDAMGFLYELIAETARSMGGGADRNATA